LFVFIFSPLTNLKGSISKHLSMGRKTKKIRALQKDALVESGRDCSTEYTQFRLMERRCRRFFLASNPSLPNVDPELLIEPEPPLPPGVILLKGHLSIKNQKRLIRESLELEHPSNLNKHFNIPDKMWETFRVDKEFMIQPKENTKLKPLNIKKAIRDLRWKILVCNTSIISGSKLRLE
jgi:hypothetical protein